jgi:SAM-dependent methyltransferase
MALNLPAIARNVELREDGLWTARTSSEVSYPEAGNQYCFAVEESSFWFQHRNECILEAIKLIPPPGVFFDIGGGNGYVAQALQNAGLEVVLIEPGVIGALNALKRGIRNVIRGTLEDAGLNPESMPAVGLFDVIEHIQNDCALMRELNALQVPGGKIYITAPAFQLLWSHEDTGAGHWRRYSLRSLSTVLKQSGYVVEFATYFFGFLLLPVMVFRALPYRLGFRAKNITEDSVRSDHQLRTAWARKVYQAFSRRELYRIRRGRSGGPGASCLVVARKISS